MKTIPPLIAASSGGNVRLLGEPDPAPGGQAHRDDSNVRRLVHALARSRALGFHDHGWHNGVRLFVSAVYADEIRDIIVHHRDFPDAIGTFRGVPVYVNDGADCVVVWYGEVQP